MNKSHKNQQCVFHKDIEGNPISAGVVRKVLAYSDAVMCVEHSFEAGTVLPVHSHPHIQIAYIVEGRFSFTIGDEVKELSKGDTFCTQGGVPHGGTCLEKGIVVDFFNPMREDFV